MTFRLCATVVVVALVACKGSRAPKPAKVEDPTQPMLAKLQGYFSCITDHTERVFATADHYDSRVDGKPPTAETPVGLRATLDPDKCLAEIIESRKLLPQNLELDTAGAAFASALSAVFVLTREGEGYFDKTSPTYAPAKGAALHDKLVAAFREFDRAQAVLFDLVMRLNREAHAAQLATREKAEGRTLAVRTDAMVLHAEELMRTMSTTYDRLDALDLPTLSARVIAYENELQELKSYAGTHSKEVTDFIGYVQLQDQIDGFVIASKQLVNRATAKLPYTDSEKLMITSGNEKSVPGTPASVAIAYNHVVDHFGVH